MATTAVTSPRPELTWSDPAPAWRRLRLVLIVAGLVLTVLGALFAERPSSLTTLEEHLASGEVDVVGLTDGLGPRGTGYATRELHWRSGWFRYHAEVIEARPRRAAREVARDRDVPVLTEDVRTRLSELRRGLRFESVAWPASTFESFGWRVPGWYGWLAMPFGLGVLALLVAGPRTWRATRWAWFWLIMTAPPGVLAFLLLGGPTRGIPAPADERRRLTGGWAFLLSIVLAGAFDLER